MGLADRDSLGAFLLPTSAQSLIQLNQGVQFIPLRLRQGQFRGKRVCFVRQNLKVVRCPGFETYLRQSRRILSGFHQVLLLDSKLTVLAISHQRVRYVAESSLDGLLVGQKQLFVLRLSQTNPGLQPPPFEDRLCQCSSQRPESCRPGKQTCQRRAFVSCSSRQ